VIFQTAVLVIALAAIGLVFWTTIRTGSSPVPTSPNVRRTMFALLPARLPGPAEGRIYELGSGWGGVAMGLARQYPDRTVVGYELSLLPWLFSRLRLLARPLANLSFRLADFRNADLSDATLCVCYLAGNRWTGSARNSEPNCRPVPSSCRTPSRSMNGSPWIRSRRVIVFTARCICTKRRALLMMEGLLRHRRSAPSPFPARLRFRDRLGVRRPHEPAHGRR